LQSFEQERKKPYITSVERIGRAEGRKEVAYRMLAANFTLKQICELTGLSEAEVRQLQQSQSAPESDSAES
jgi:predicted transposase YdaD